MSANSTPELDGKRALIEVREGRRWHRMVVADLKKNEEGICAVFQDAYPRNNPDLVTIKIPAKQLGQFERVEHRDYEFKFGPVLYRGDDQSVDTGAWVRPPTIVTKADIDAMQDENSEQTGPANPRPFGTSGTASADSASRAEAMPEASGDS